MHRRLPAVVALLVCLVAAAVACGPEGPVEAGGADAKPVAALTILPSPGQLRGQPATAADEAALQRAFTGTDDPELVTTLQGRGMRSAGVRTWSGPNGQELVATVSVWDSHLLATGIGAQIAELLLKTDGAASWTPRDLNGSRGVRVDTPNAREQRLSLAVGPNTVYVRAVGPVPDGVVATATDQLVRYLEGQDG